MVANSDLYWVVMVLRKGRFYLRSWAGIGLFVPTLMAVALTLIAPPRVAWGQDEGVSNWLKWVGPDIERNDVALSDWRRAHPQLSSKLLVIAGSQSSSLKARRGAIYVLGVAGDTLLVVNALQRLEGDSVVRAEVSAALARVKVRLGLLAQLSRGRAHGSAPMGSAGAETLEALARTLDAQTLRELFPLVADRLVDRRTRSVAARLLGWAGESGPAAALLIQVARDDPFAGYVTREACLLALATRGEERRLVQICLALRESPQDWELLRRGVALLNTSGAAFRILCKGLFAEGESAPDLQVMIAGDLADRSASDLVPFLSKLVLQGRGFDPREHLRLALALIRLDPKALAANVPRLVEGALSTDDDLADEAVAALGELRPPQLKASLERVFERPDPSGELRVVAVQLVELLSLTDLAPRLEEFLQDAAMPWSIRQASAHALGALGGKASVRALAGVLLKAEAPSGEFAALRREAADALAACEPRDPRGRQALEVALGDSEPTIRRAVLRALAAYADPQSASSVRALVERKPASGRECEEILRAAVALDMFDPQSAQLLLGLRVNGFLAALASVTYARHLESSLAVDALIDLLEHPVGQVRTVAASELLRRYPAGRAFGYHLARGAQERRRAIDAWRRAWREKTGSFR
jgi:hypothetical protein